MAHNAEPSPAEAPQNVTWLGGCNATTACKHCAVRMKGRKQPAPKANRRKKRNRA